MSSPLRAFMVCVDYLDILKITLPWNAKHFAEVNIVTDPAGFDDLKEYIDSADLACAQVWVSATDAFYRDGATFNKWLALENLYDDAGRDGWICNLDADVLWPRHVRVEKWGSSGQGLIFVETGDEEVMDTIIVDRDVLFSPFRRMWDTFPVNRDPIRTSDILVGDLPIRIPGEKYWKDYPRHRNVREWAGYTQIFHGGTRHLPQAPWHEVNWKHAGGADSFFQDCWPGEVKLRPDWEVLHLGQAGVNWFGRSGTYADGSTPEQAKEKYAKYMQIWIERAKRRREGRDPFSPEKIRKPS